MKRITYISKITPGLDAGEIAAIGEVSARNNHKQGISGILVCTAGIFFQIIEGEEAALDTLYLKIAADPRHTDVVCLRAELAVSERLFPEWDMHTVNLDQNSEALHRPFRALLQHLGQTHQIIQRYTQPAVSAWIEAGRNPLEVPPRTCEKIVLFSDIVGFSALTERLPVESVASLVNSYLDVCTACIVEHGGEVSKYIGDCVMACFQPTQADAALRAGLAILDTLREIRRHALPDSPLAYLRSGVGLAAGTVLEGNLGSSLKMDYTVLGDTVNTAARIESLTRQTGHALLFSASVKTFCREAWDFQPVGEYALKGKHEQVEVYTVRAQPLS